MQNSETVTMTSLSRGIMRFLPVEHVVYRLRVPEEELMRRLQQLYDADLTLSIWPIDSEPAMNYDGGIEGRTFHMRRVPMGRAGLFMPPIKGVMESTTDGTRVTVKMRANLVAWSVMCIWCAVSLLSGIWMLWEMLSRGSLSLLGWLPWGSLLLGYGLTMLNFRKESDRTLKDLQKIFSVEGRKE